MEGKKRGEKKVYLALVRRGRVCKVYSLQTAAASKTKAARRRVFFLVNAC